MFLNCKILVVVNTRTRQVEQRTDYYPYGMPHGSATGAGLNKRKYSGKELITFAGYDAMDYHARWRPTALPLFTTPDPLAEKRQGISIYAYCGGDPVNRIDPSGMEWDYYKSQGLTMILCDVNFSTALNLSQKQNQMYQNAITKQMKKVILFILIILPIILQISCTYYKNGVNSNSDIDSSSMLRYYDIVDEEPLYRNVPLYREQGLFFLVNDIIDYIGLHETQLQSDSIPWGALNISFIVDSLGNPGCPNVVFNKDKSYSEFRKVLFDALLVNKYWSAGKVKGKPVNVRIRVRMNLDPKINDN